MKEEVQIHKKAYQAYFGKRGAELFAQLMELLARLLSIFHPNTITIISFTFAIGAGICIYCDSYFLLLGSLFILLNFIFDLLDGIVARQRNLASQRGAFLDLVLDRCSDIAIFSGITLAPYTHRYLGFLAIISIFMVAYLRLFKMSLSRERAYPYVTIFGHTALRLALFIACILQYIFILSGLKHFYFLSMTLSLLDFVTMLITVVNIIISIFLFKEIWKRFGKAI